MLRLTVNLPKAAKQQRPRKADFLTPAVLNGHRAKPFGKGILWVSCQQSLKPIHAIAAIESGVSLSCTGLQARGDRAEARAHFTHTL